MELKSALVKPPIASVQPGANPDAEDPNAILIQNRRMADNLERVADILADAGVIHNTPLAKRQWVSATKMDY